MFKSEDLFCDRDRVRLGSVDKLGNSHGCMSSGDVNQSIGSSNRSVKEPAACARPRSTVTRSSRCTISERIDPVARTILLLIAGPGCEALLVSGAFEPVANRLAAALESLHTWYRATSLPRPIRPATAASGLNPASKAGRNRSPRLAGSGRSPLTRLLPPAFPPVGFVPPSGQHAAVAPQAVHNSQAGR
jgi:hypothetical protein